MHALFTCWYWFLTIGKYLLLAAVPALFIWLLMGMPGVL